MGPPPTLTEPPSSRPFLKSSMTSSHQAEERKEPDARRPYQTVPSEKRNAETICDTGLCCGAARIPVGKAVMTIETCGTAGTKYEYTPPRGPMATAWPTAKDYPFTCIEGAKNLAAAASALAAAVYMLA